MMKTDTLIIISIVCGMASAYFGAAGHWSDTDGCMLPAPITGIIYAVEYGVCGLICGAFLSFLHDVTIGQQEAQEAPLLSSESNETNTLLLPASSPVIASETLLRPAMEGREIDPASLLRASQEISS